MELKLFSGSIVEDSSLTDRQIRVVANSGKSDRVKDVLVAKGCKLDNYAKNPIVLADHDPSKPIGNFAPEISDAVGGVITFAPKGISAKADEYCGLYKAGVLKTVSVGFQPIDYEPNKAGGYDYKAWELMELSCVAVPCDPNAVVTARAYQPGAAKSAPVWKVGASLNLPIGGDDSWDGAAAEAAIFAHCGFDGAAPDANLARKAFLAYDGGDPRQKTSYRLPFAKVADGRLTATPAGLAAAAAALALAELPEDCRRKARAALDSYEDRMKPKAAPGKVDKVITLVTAPKIKGLYDVASLAQLLMNLGYMHSSAVQERDWEGDDSKLPEMLAGALKLLADAFLAMSKEEIGELLAGHDIEIEDDDYVLAAPTPETKRFRSAFVKAGRALSAENAKHVQAIIKCMGKAMDCRTKALDSHGQTHANLEDFAAHLNEAGEHAKSLMKAAKKKPKPGDGGDGDGEDTSGEDLGGDDDDDGELGYEVERRKRALDLVTLARTV